MSFFSDEHKANINKTNAFRHTYDVEFHGNAWYLRHTDKIESQFMRTIEAIQAIQTHIEIIPPLPRPQIDQVLVDLHRKVNHLYSSVSELVDSGILLVDKLHAAPYVPEVIEIPGISDLILSYLSIHPIK